MPINNPTVKKLYDRLYQKAHRIRLLAARRERYATDPEYRAVQIARAKAYREAHKADPAYLKRRRDAAREYQRRRKAKLDGG